jgi:hypothetical protein
MIDAVESAGRAGLIARVRGCLGRGWGDDFASDMGALDAGLQAALLWARHSTHGAFLPTSIGRICITEPVAGALRCILVGHRIDDARGVCDVALVDMAGRTVASLEHVELHRLGDDAAFSGAARAVTDATAAARTVA